MAIAGHVSRKMIEHYSHIRMEAKRAALDAIAKPAFDEVGAQNLGTIAARNVPHYFWVARHATRIKVNRAARGP